LEQTVKAGDVTIFGLSEDDRLFWRDCASGAVRPGDFDHRAHLRLAYVHFAAFGPETGATAFKESLFAYLARHGIDCSKYHETVTRAWLLAVWHFMRKAGATASSQDFLDKSQVLLDSRVMLTHYSKDLLFSDLARRQFVEPDLDPIPSDVGCAAKVPQWC
jgi:hypothetical protein